MSRIRRKKHVMKFQKNSATFPTNLCKAFHNTFNSEAGDSGFISVPAEVAVMHTRTASLEPHQKFWGPLSATLPVGEKNPN